MAEQNQETTPPNAGATDGLPQGGEQPPVTPAATNPPKAGDAATHDDDVITLPKKDYQNLISQRDGNHETAAQQSAFIESIAREKGINQFLTDNKDKYPDVGLEDLSHVEDPESLEREAIRIQKRLEDHAQAKILSIENPETPRITPEQRAQAEADLAKNPDAKSLEKMIAGRMG